MKGAHQMEIDVKQTAYLARIDLSGDDQKRVANELKSVLEHMNRLFEARVESVPPTFTLGDVDSIRLAEDIPHESLCREVVMESAVSIHEGYFKVPRESQGV